MNNFVSILGITGIWFSVWVILYLISNMFVEIAFYKSEWKQRKRIIQNGVILIVIFFYILQIIDYLSFVSGNKLF